MEDVPWGDGTLEACPVALMAVQGIFPAPLVGDSEVPVSCLALFQNVVQAGSQVGCQAAFQGGFLASFRDGFQVGCVGHWVLVAGVGMMGAG